MHLFGCSKRISPFNAIIPPMNTPQVSQPKIAFSKTRTPKTNKQIAL